MGNWKVRALFVSDVSIPIGTPCDYAFDFGGSLAYNIRDNGIRVDLQESGKWSFDEGNAQLVLQFKGADGQDLPDGKYTCQVTGADSKMLKFTYADINGLISRVELDKVPS